eukprot:5439696-Pleurochrysis_carterae.AAC.1
MACALPPSQGATHESTHALEGPARRRGRAVQRRVRATRTVGRASRSVERATRTRSGEPRGR